MVEQYLLEMNNISKEFPGVKALDQVTIKVKPGTVHALMGENGAGKSTLMKCLFGIYKKNTGQIILDGREVDFQNTKQALENGVAMVQQELNQATKLSVMDNLWLGRYPTSFIMVDHKKMYDDTLEIFKQLNIQVNPRELLQNLSVSQRQMLEIAKAVSYESKIIAFDEPTSSLTEREIEHLFRIIKMLKNKGCGIIYISHKMEEILAISDEVTILRDGKWVSTTPARDLTMKSIIKQMVGRELTNRFPPKTNTPGGVILQVKNLSKLYNPKISDVSFDLRKGEILGISGLVGSGRTELVETLFGIAAKSSGEIIINGNLVENRNTKMAKKNGFALLTEERRATGIFSVLDIKANTTIANLDKYHSLFGLSEEDMVKDTQNVIDVLRVKVPSQKTKIRSLSGGNQQKVILGRWLLTAPNILLLDEPTRGIDVGAKYEIYQLMIQLASEGKSIIMVSSEMPELIGVCDRILVMSEGKVAGIVNAQETSQEAMMALTAKYL